MYLRNEFPSDQYQIIYILLSLVFLFYVRSLVIVLNVYVKTTTDIICGPENANKGCLSEQNKS